MPTAQPPGRSSATNAGRASAITPNGASSSEADERPAPVSAWQRFWHRYSAHGEFPLSSMSSIGVHVLLLLLVMLLTTVLTKREPQQLGVDVIRVGDEPQAAAGEMAGRPGDAGLTESQSENVVPEPPDAPPTEQLRTDASPDQAPAVSVSAGADVKSEAAAAAESAATTVRRAQQSLAQAKSRLAKNMNAGSGGQGTSGPGDGRTGNTPGAGGAGTTGRAARQGRWILRVRPISIDNLLAQYEGLGAVLAFPLNGERYRFFSKLTGRPPHSEVKTLSDEGRLYFVEEKAQQISGLSEVLDTSVPAYILVFLPQELENRMVKMEHDYRNLSEEQIASTKFAVVARGGGYDVIVVEQEPR